MKYIRICPKEYAQELKVKYRENPEKWYDVITPKTAANELIAQTDNDYSKVWHEHCEECYKVIDMNSADCYVSDDGFSWLCSDCFHKMNKVCEKLQNNQNQTDNKPKNEQPKCI